MIQHFQDSLKAHPPIPPGAPDDFVLKGGGDKRASVSCRGDYSPDRLTVVTCA